MVEKNSFSGVKCIVNQCCNKYAFLSYNLLPLVSPAVKVIHCVYNSLLLVSPAVKVIHCMGATRNSAVSAALVLMVNQKRLASYSYSLIPESGKPLVDEASAFGGSRKAPVLKVVSEFLG